MPDTSYSYSITTVDTSGNRSVTSPTFTIKTLVGQMTNDGSASSNDDKQTFSWSHPAARQNGDYLELDAIGGYEIRFKSTPNDDFTYLNIEGNRTTSISTNLIPINSSVEISAYDINGLYSMFVSIRPE